MRYCNRCVYPDTKPGIKFDVEGVCSGCRAQEAKRTAIDWDTRWRELERLVAAHKSGQRYDCLIPVSGGKDSHVQVHYATRRLGLRPLCVSVAPQVVTEEGRHNLENLKTAYGVDLVVLHPNPDVSKRIARAGLMRNAWPNWGHDKLIYSWPIRIALDFGIPLVIMGENHDFESGGKDLGGGADAFEQMVHSLDGELDAAAWEDFGLKRQDLLTYQGPAADQLRKSKIAVLWMGYFVNWDSHAVYEMAHADGFRPLAKPRLGTIDSYHGIDDLVVLVNAWLKFVKFGFGRVTDVAFNHISYGRMTRREAVDLVNDLEGVLDPEVKTAFCSYTRCSEDEFGSLVARFASGRIVEWRDGRWWLRSPVA